MATWLPRGFCWSLAPISRFETSMGSLHLNMPKRKRKPKLFVSWKVGDLTYFNILADAFRMSFASQSISGS
eukprot:m.260134 g.260134  ORF g.260134 m.260134 type:complete len:71 (+) comp54594_c0_seq8:379-591(+)